MIRTKGEAGTGDIVNAVRHMRAVFGDIRRLGTLSPEELFTEAKELRRRSSRPLGGRERTPARRHLHRRRDRHSRRCRALHAAGRRRRLRRLGHLQVGRPARPREGDRRGDDALPRPEILARVSTGLGEPMRGLDAAALAPEELLETRGW